MTPEERRAYEQEAPTLGPDARVYATLSEKNEAFLTAALRGDVPRMAAALKQGASPTARSKRGNTAANHYVIALTTPSLLTGPFPTTTFQALHPPFRETLLKKGWTWLKESGVPLHQKEGETPWSMLFQANHTPPEMNLLSKIMVRAEYYWPERNLWALWSALSTQERHDVLLWMDNAYQQEEKSSSSLPQLHPSPLKESPFSSRSMQEAVYLEESGCALDTSLFPPHMRQERQLILSSLLAFAHGSSFFSLDEALLPPLHLGLWAYAPPLVLKSLEHMPAYHVLRDRCITSFTRQLLHQRPLCSTPDTPGCSPGQNPFLSTFPASMHKTHYALLTRRLVFGVTHLLEEKYPFPPEMCHDLAQIEELRPLLERTRLEEALAKDVLSPSTQQQESASHSSSSSRVRL